jgi:hypothetical protein
MGAHSRGKYKERYWSDPEFRSAILRRRRQKYRDRWKGSSERRNDPKKVKAAREAKLERCPQFARLLYLTSTVHRLRNQIETHQSELLQEEKKLIKLSKELQMVREMCRGK